MLSKRILGGLFYTIVLVGGIFLRLVDVRFFDAVILLFTIVAAIEVSNAFKAKLSFTHIGFILLSIVLGYVAFLFFGLYMFFTGVIITIVILFITMLFSKEMNIKSVSSTIFTIIYPVTLFAFLLQINTISDAGKFMTASLKNTNFATGLLGILLVFLISSFSDVFAYGFGVTIGKKFNHKLCPTISPKKTIEGAIGGLFGGIIASMIIFILCFYNVLGMFLFPVPLWANIIIFICLGLFGSFFTQCGDLIASIIKRNCEIKDFGKIILGHGGIMDRMDGVLFNSIFIYCFMMLFNLAYPFL